MRVLFGERSDDAPDRPDLLRAVRRDELLSNTVAAHHPWLRAKRDDQPVVRRKDGRENDAPWSTEAYNQRLVEYGRRSGCCTASREPPANSFPVSQSMTSASVRHPSRADETRHRAVAPRSLGVVATPGGASIYGRWPIALLPTCQPLSSSTRWNVYLLKRKKLTRMR